MPTISLICATYNRYNLIITLIECLKAQLYKDWECIIVDDHSTDGTYEKLFNLSLDNRFRLFTRGEKHKKGLSGSRNFGIGKALGKYIMFIDDDDLVPNYYLEVCYSAISNNNTDFIHFQKQSFYDEKDVDLGISTNLTIEFNKSISITNIHEHLWGELALASCTLILKLECFKDFQFNEDLGYSEEWNLYGKLLISGYRGYSINNVLYYNRKHVNSNTGQYYIGDPKYQAFNRLAHEDLLSFILINRKKLKKIEYFKSIKYFYKKAHKNNWKKIIIIMKDNTILDFFLVKILDIQSFLNSVLESKKSMQ
jgi:GalNAc5-diNAcBac-PP-undecaprenol beta-1,3-glucosyltransferase